MSAAPPLPPGLTQTIELQTSVESSASNSKVASLEILVKQLKSENASLKLKLKASQREISRLSKTLSRKTPLKKSSSKIKTPVNGKNSTPVGQRLPGSKSKKLSHIKSRLLQPTASTKTRAMKDAEKKKREDAEALTYVRFHI